ncbi:MAG: PaaI family thioesterase [Oceanicaulis sp.]
MSADPYALAGDPVADAAEAIAQSPFNNWLAPEVLRIDTEAGEAEMALAFKPEFARLPGSDGFHGGVLAAFMDMVGDFAVVAVVRKAVPTVNLRIDYMRPCGGGAVRAVGKARRVGRTMAVVDVDLFDAAGKLSAVARGTYAVPA